MCIPAFPSSCTRESRSPAWSSPEDLRFHVRDAVLTARTDRIGHGVDIRHEDDYRELLRLMARRHVLVEVPLTSNAQVLGVTGPAHPRGDGTITLD